jgi:hypothetical protein
MLSRLPSLAGVETQGPGIPRAFTAFKSKIYIEATNFGFKGPARGMS